MQPYKGVEQEQARCMAPHGLGEAVLIRWQVEPDAGRGNDPDRQGGEVQATVTAEALEPLLDDGRRVFGHVDQRAAGLGDAEGVQARSATGDRDSEVKSEPALPQFRLCGAPHNRNHGANRVMWRRCWMWPFSQRVLPWDFT